MLKACIYTNDALEVKLSQEVEDVFLSRKWDWVGRLCVAGIRWAQEAIHWLILDNTDDAVSSLSPSVKYGSMQYPQGYFRQESAFPPCKIPQQWLSRVVMLYEDLSSSNSKAIHWQKLHHVTAARRAC